MSQPTPILRQDRQPITTNPSRPAAVYRIYNFIGDTIYVGAAYDPWERIKTHRIRASWRFKIDSYSADWYATRVEADQVEAEIIEAEHPIYNVRGTDLHRAVSLGLVVPTSRGEIESYSADVGPGPRPARHGLPTNGHRSRLA